jgi:RNA polymerase sigma-70 factor (TIGR02960 family)
MESDETGLIAEAQRGDQAAFEKLAVTYTVQLHAYCYRMLGSVHDADDALQETLLGAWRGIGGFEGRSSLRSWLYRIATHACLRLAENRQRSRMLPTDFGPAWTQNDDLGSVVAEPMWLEPYPDTDPTARSEKIENIELALIAALQHLPASQRAVLILREVLQFSAAEVAQVLGTSVAAVNSSLQRARKVVGDGLPRQDAELRDAGELVVAFASAWERADVAAMVELLAEDVRFSMPPLPAWFAGREDVIRFMDERMFATTWRLVRVRANGQLAFACYQEPGLGAICVVTLRGGRITELTGFLDPAVKRRFMRDESGGRAVSVWVTRPEGDDDDQSPGRNPRTVAHGTP